MTENNASVLLADDDESIIDATSMMLEYVGYHVKGTIDGAKVLAMAQSLPDVIILDVWMSGVDGRDICKLLKTGQDTSRIPIIMISASKDIKSSVMACGADDFVEKPFDIEILIASIGRLIGN